MNQGIAGKLLTIFFGIGLLLLSSCAGIKYNAGTVSHANSISAQTYSLIDRSSSDFVSSAPQIQQLKDSFQMAINFEVVRGKSNYATINMWKLIDKYIECDFLGVWSKDHKLGQNAVDELKKRLSKNFDYIKSFEENKVNGPSDVNKKSN